jgi:hypothetical protein
MGLGDEEVGDGEDFSVLVVVGEHLEGRVQLG